MRKALIALTAFAAVAMLVLSSTAPAAGNENTGTTANDYVTVGDCISDGLYGNEPNMADGSAGGPAEQESGTKGGNVLPTQSPGPWVNNASDPDNPTRGKSAGQWNQLGANIPELCRTAVGR